MELPQRLEYARLVEARKACRLCEGELVNPSRCCGGAYDSNEIGPWTCWQGGLNAPLMVVGQDWADAVRFEKQRGVTQADNPTNATLIQLLRAAGVEISAPGAPVKGESAFFTNAILCLKTEGRMQGEVQGRWFDRCGKNFLLPMIRLIRPRVVVTLGERAFRVLQSLYGLQRTSFAVAVERPEGFELESGVRLFPRYHCGRRIINTHRALPQQIADWQRLAPFLRGSRDSRAA